MTPRRAGEAWSEAAARVPSSGRTRRSLPGFAAAVAAVLLAGSAGPVRAQVALPELIERAAAYVAAYQQRLSMVVAQERYQQEVRYPAPPMSRLRDITQRTVLVSDFLLVRTSDAAWVPFRDVFERDGVPVRDRADRLSALFLESASSAFEQARRISDESARYNIGNISRNINVPTMALEFLDDVRRARVDFEFDGGLSSGGIQVVRYRERRGRTYIRTTNDGDLPASGRFWIHEPTGRIERTELRTSGEGLDGLITVTYRMDEDAGLYVPDRMEELYEQRRDRSEIRGTAVYSRYRRFQITTSDELAR